MTVRRAYLTIDVPAGITGEQSGNPNVRLHNSVGTDPVRRRLYDGDGGKPNASTTRRGAVTWQKETAVLRQQLEQQTQQNAQLTQQVQAMQQAMQQLLERLDGGAAPAAAGGSVSDWASSLFGSRK